MSSRAARMIVLCEDLQHAAFVRRLLKRLGFPGRRIRVERAPSGSGSAEQYVRERYPVEAEVYRRKAARMNIGLVVVVDADTITVSERCRELRRSARDAGQKPRVANDRICLLIPKRNIETWIYALRGESVNESDEYPKLDKESNCASDVEALVQHMRNDDPQDVPVSLRRGCQELKTRLPS